MVLLERIRRVDGKIQGAQWGKHRPV